ncbi:MAG: phosphoribosylformylglycinamidine synthase I [Candidatus Omnitrophica bacterium]|nr:phosphoribosylformylglycinamidine synthase I [Candidatus Omnitrophota bacterium]
MRKPRVCVLRTAGTNCDYETAFAFKRAQAEVELVHINTLLKAERNLLQYHILALPGGFTYGDDIAAGKVFANELRCRLRQSLTEFVLNGRLIIGICNGFQILVKSGLLPGNTQWTQEASLIINDSGLFRDEWVYLRHQPQSSECVWTRNIPTTIYLPIAHGEGKFVVKNKEVLERIKANRQIVFRYVNNPNGSVEDIAGICDKTGRILGLMPHPERHIDVYQHPHWHKTASNNDGHGLLIFRNGVEYAKRHLV